MKIASIVGTRPQFIKLAPLVRAIQEHNKSNSKLKIEHLIIHTGQHYDYEMNKIFFDELGIPEPDCNLEVGSGSHGWQTGKMIQKIEEVLIKEKINLAIVYGDTNSSLAGSLASSKLHIPLGHIEAGLRSYNKKMPEEINRVLIDHCSNILFCPTENATENLKKEGFTNILFDGKLTDLSSIKLPIINSQLAMVINVGDIMYEALSMSLEIAEKNSTILKKLKLEQKAYYLATIHRAENTDNKDRLKNIVEAFAEISKEKPVVFPIHPRTKKNIEKLHISSHPFNKFYMIDPVSYFEMLMLLKNAKKILTDSGGVQKESYFLGVPCITLRNETEWIETVQAGWNIIVGTNKKRIIESTLKSSAIPDYNSLELFGDGKTVEKILNIFIKDKYI